MKDPIVSYYVELSEFGDDATISITVDTTLSRLHADKAKLYDAIFDSVNVAAAEATVMITAQE